MAAGSTRRGLLLLSLSSRPSARSSCRWLRCSPRGAGPPSQVDSWQVSARCPSARRSSTFSCSSTQSMQTAWTFSVRFRRVRSMRVRALISRSRATDFLWCLVSSASWSSIVNQSGTGYGSARAAEFDGRSVGGRIGGWPTALLILAAVVFVLSLFGPSFSSQDPIFLVKPLVDSAAATAVGTGLVGVAVLVAVAAALTSISLPVGCGRPDRCRTRRTRSQWNQGDGWVRGRRSDRRRFGIGGRGTGRRGHRRDRRFSSLPRFQA